MAEEFYSFDKALEKLKLREEELRRLVSEGEIRAYRSGETMKLRREDVEKLQKELNVPGAASEQVVDLEGGTEELIFSEEEPAEVVEEKPGMETVQISEEETLVVDEPKRRRETVEEAVELEAAEEVEEAPAPARRGKAVAARQATVEANEGTLNRVLLMTTAAVLLISSFAMVNVANMENSAPMGLFKTIGSMFAGK